MGGTELSERMDALERHLRAIRATFLTLVAAVVTVGVVSACTVSSALPSQAGRYAIASIGGQVHRLDTATGEIRAFIIGPERAVQESLRELGAKSGTIPFVEIGSLPPVDRQ